MPRSPASEIERAAELLRNGGLVAFPTETVYGLGANALDPVAVARIFEAKQRPSFDPLIVHLADWSEREMIVGEWTELAQQLVSAFPSGPLTLVLRASSHVPSIVTSGLSTVAVRVPSHPIAHSLIAAAGVPIAAPSANKFGHLSPTRAEHVREGLGSSVDLVIDDGATDWGVESTIVDASSDQPVLLRYGAITHDQLEGVIGRVATRMSTSFAPSAPGQLDSHYAPRTSLRLVDHDVAPSNSAAYLGFTEAPSGFRSTAVLSPSGDLREAATNLFEALHRLDRVGVETIHAELVPNNGLGRAINDRLRRASAK